MNLKKITSSFVASACIAGSFPVVGAYAADNDPKIYVDIVHEDSGAYRADVILENIDNFTVANLHVDLGQS